MKIKFSIKFSRSHCS